MNKDRRKEILNDYKKKELEKLSQLDDKILADFAKNKLGLKSDQLTLEKLRSTPDDRLIELVADKIKEVLAVKYRSNPKKYKNTDNVILELNESLRLIHFTNIFEMHVIMGDTEKFLNGATSFELTEIISGYRLIKLDNVSDNISFRKILDIDKELSDQKKIRTKKIEYIREHLNDFELN